MDARRAIAITAALLLATSLMPASTASHQQVPVPPHETGLGSNDVRDEPNHALDANGFTDGILGPTQETQVLESFYVVMAPAAANVDVNNVVNRIVHGDDHDRYESYMYPGTGFFGAWWGWWEDTGGGGQLQAHGLGSGPNGAIDDAHDNTDNWDNPEHGPWDEFVWRGVNPWASQHGHESHPGDYMHIFISPGTHYAGVLPVADLDDAKDDPRIPDWEFSDRTDYGAYLAYPVFQRGGWVSSNGWYTIQYDQSLLIATETVTAVNSKQVGDGFYDPFTPAGDAADHAVDVDAYTSIHPAAESLYRTTVYDPGDEVGGPGDGLVHEEGPKQFAKEFSLGEAVEPYLNHAEDAARPGLVAAQPVRGAADDARGAKPWAHEPNTPSDDYNGYATHDPSTSYGGTPYYDPGPNQRYDGYQDEEHAWLDAQVGYGVPGFTPSVSIWFFLNAYPAPNTGDASDRTQSPGFLGVSANFGTWLDSNGDTWVGNVTDPVNLGENEEGNTEADTVRSSESDPYAGGLVDDPNDYGDYPDGQPPEDDPNRLHEWRGLCGGNTVRATFTPQTPNQRWGVTGVYVHGDAQGGFNPYDDVAADTLGSGPWGQDEDGYQGGGQFSRHVTQGPITFDLRCSQLSAKSGGWFEQDMIVVPTGTLSYPVEVTTVGTVGVDRTARSAALNQGNLLQGETVVDVDVLRPVAG